MEQPVAALAPPPADRTSPPRPQARDLCDGGPLSDEEAASLGGLFPEHVKGIRELAKKEKLLTVVRANNPAARQWYADLSVRPKSEPYKWLKSDRAMGLLASGGGQPIFDADGYRMHSDIDLMLVLRQRAVGWERPNIDPGDDPTAEFIRRLNEAFNKYLEIKKDWVQHADQVSFLRTDFQQLFPKHDENFLVVEPDGTVRGVCGSPSLETYLESKQIPWPFPYEQLVKDFLDPRIDLRDPRYRNLIVDYLNRGGKPEDLAKYLLPGPDAEKYPLPHPSPEMQEQFFELLFKSNRFARQFLLRGYTP
jgi:hypothetical protein